jgi:hypothetical protein
MQSADNITNTSLECCSGYVNFDIMFAVLMLSHYIVLPREGHLQQVFHLFAYLKHHKHLRMVFDNTEPIFDENAFRVCNWSEFYPDVEKVIPHNALEVRGNGVVTSTFIDLDHAGCKAMRRNKVPIL